MYYLKTEGVNVVRSIYYLVLHHTCCDLVLNHSHFVN